MNELLERIIKHPASIPTLVGVTSFAVGIGAGIFIERKRNQPSTTVMDEYLYDQEEYRKRAQEYDTADINGEYVEEDDTDESGEVDPRSMAVIPEEVYEEKTAKDEDEEPVPVNHSVFADNGDDWDFEAELKFRDDNHIYPIHVDEYQENERDYAQVTLSYYAGDDVIVDPDDDPVFNYRTATGELVFGHGSNDPNVVYIRNERLGCEYEILRHTGLYSQEVLGLEMEENQRVADLKHSDRRKFREE